MQSYPRLSEKRIFTLVYVPNSDTYLEMNKDKDYFEGDILLTQQQNDFLTRMQRNSSLQGRALIRDVRKLWPNKIVPYEIADDMRE